VAIFYRAIWADSRNDIIDQACDRFCSWVREKSDGLLNASGTDEQTDDNKFVFRLRDAMSEDNNEPVSRVLTGTLIENRDDGSRWTTTLRAWNGPRVQVEAQGSDTWLWVDVEAVSRESLDGVVMGAPRFVCDVLGDGEDAHRHGVPVSATPYTFEGEEGAEGLAELLTDVERDIPVVVFSPLPDWFDARGLPPGRSVEYMYQEAMRRAARVNAGLALVCHVDAAARKSFAEAIGDSYAVRDGAFRIYLPGLDPALEEEWRHRYTLPSRYIKHASIAGKLISRSISLRAGTIRPPDSYESASKLHDSVDMSEHDELGELLELADEENAQLWAQISLQDQKYLELVDDQQLLEAENNALRDKLYVARKKLELSEQELWAKQSLAMQRINDEQLPADAESPSDAAAMAQQYLSDYLAFPPEACVDLDDIDTCVEAPAWGSSSWRAFRSLHAYVESVAGGVSIGDFWTWCKDSQHPLAWPATSKKLSMVESDIVKAGKKGKYKKKREFPVDHRVNASGKEFMEAHIKIAEGGGALAPRIYFLVSNVTQKVHIGYFGPHRNVPNSRA
jgi:hypothetical protein